MTDPQQLRRALGEIRRALEGYPREALVEVLALVFKEYVVEGREPIASGGHVLDARSDIEGLSFPELIVWLQTHADAPELALFEVSGGSVSVRVDGRSVALRAAPPAAPTPPPARAAPVAPAPPAAPAATPPAAPSATPPAAPSATPPTAGPVAPAPAKEEPNAAETGTRFSLLEVD